MDFHSFEMIRFEMDDLSGTFLNFRSKRDREVHSLRKRQAKRKQAAVLKFPIFKKALTTPLAEAFHACGHLSMGQTFTLHPPPWWGLRLLDKCTYWHLCATEHQCFLVTPWIRFFLKKVSFWTFKKNVMIITGKDVMRWTCSHITSRSVN